MRKLFCEISPLTYKISKYKEILLRSVKDSFNICTSFAKTKVSQNLPILVYKHSSLIRRKLGDVAPVLQENKAKNLALVVPCVSGVIIKPGEVFSFWKLTGHCTARKGFLPGLTIVNGKPQSGTGGGICQFTNLLHWMVLHSPLDVIEHHHHNGVDLFPDYGRKVPFGVGTSIAYNKLDYRLKNNTGSIFQFIIYITGEHLYGELRADAEQAYTYRVTEEEAYFERKEEKWYRNNKIYRSVIDKSTGKVVHTELLLTNHALVMYDEKYIRNAM